LNAALYSLCVTATPSQEQDARVAGAWQSGESAPRCRKYLTGIADGGENA